MTEAARNESADRERTADDAASEPIDEMLGEATADLQAVLEEADRKVRGFVRERPLVALGGAVVAGFLMARLLSRD